MSRPPARFAPVLAVIALVAALVAAGPRQVLSYADGGGRWVVRRVEATPATPEHVAILARGEGGRLFERATLGRAPAQVAGFGERLAMLFDDGTWSLASTGGVIAGPALPDGRKAIAIATIDGSLLILAAHETLRPKLLRFDGNTFADAGEAPAPAGEAQMLASRGLIAIGSLTGEGVALDLQIDGQWRPRTTPVPADGAWLLDDRLAGASLVTRDGLAWASRSIGRDGALGPPLAIDAGRIVGRREVGASRVGGELRLTWVDGPAVVEQTFDAAGRPVGKPIESRTDVVAHGVPSVFERGLSALSVVAIALVLLTAGRRATGDVEVPAVEAPTPAPVGTRAIAGLIDAWPLYLACGLIVATTAPDESGHVSLASPRVQLMLAAGVFVYVAVCFASELFWGRTAGKALLGLRVVRVDGGRPTTAALAIRNGLRLLDLNVVLLMMVPLSALRQRLADLMAGTMVVDARTANPPASRKSAADGADKES